VTNELGNKVASSLEGIRCPLCSSLVKPSRSNNGGIVVSGRWYCGQWWVVLWSMMGAIVVSDGCYCGQ